jgi:hypothetical protein
LRGGLTPTFDLEATSPAIDAAQDATCPTIDQRGVARPVDYPGLGATETCDIGAVELLPQGRR